MVDKSKFKYKTQIRVRNYEVDWQGIVHNGNYLLYFEVARIEYLKHIGANLDLTNIQSAAKIVLVRNEIDYKSSAQFDDLLNVYMRISFIKNTSFGLEGIMEKADNGKLISYNLAYHVWLDQAADRPKIIGDEFRRLVEGFEGKDCDIVWPTYNV